MNKKIFIIEDNVNFLYGLLARFVEKGFETLPENGNNVFETVFEKIVVTKPNYIILDLILPNIDSWNLLYKIKENYQYIKAPVFVCADDYDTNIEQRSLNLGADYFLAKNETTIDQLAEKITKIILNREKVTL